MEWTYQIRAAARPRVLMRLAQVFDQQMVSMRRCEMLEAVDGIEISITVDISSELAERIQAKLYKQQDLLQVTLLSGRRPLPVIMEAATR